MKLQRILAFGLILIAAACSPGTQIKKSWTDPSLTGGNIKPFNKVLVIASIKDESTRRIAEDKIAEQVKGIAVQSYSYLQPGDTVKAIVEEKLKKDGFDGVILMRLVNVEKSTSYVPGSYSGGWYGYRYSTPGYYTEDKTVLVETNIYSLASGKMLWSGTTSSLNPTKFDKTLDDIITALKTELQQKGLIK